MKTRYHTRKRSGTGFSYYDEKGERITDKNTIARYTSLRIPPAWNEVRIAVSTRAKVLASGTDAKGRSQAIYHPRYRQKQEEKKFERILLFAHALPNLRMQVERDMKLHSLRQERVLACIVTLIDEAYFRVGNKTYADENNSYGITTLMTKHVTTTPSKVTFDFIGKSGKHHHKVITNTQIARVMRQLDDLPGKSVFQYIDSETGNIQVVTSEDVNAYIKQYMGADFTAKDFRTWGGTLVATMQLVMGERADTERERKKAVTACVRAVAKKLGNTPAVARSSYIDPRVLSSYLHSDNFVSIAKTLSRIRPKKYMKPEEQITLRLLTQQ